MDDTELQAFSGDFGSHCRGVAQQGLRHRQRLLGEDGDTVGFDDAGLLFGDAFGRVGQVVRVVDGDRGDDGDVGVHHIGGVPRAAHAHFDNGDVHGSVSEGGVRHHREDFEERHGHVVLLVHHPHVRQHVA